MAKVFQIGSGLVGKTMAIDLSKDHDLHLADFDVENLKKVKSINPEIKVENLNIKNKFDLKSFIQPADIVLLAVPGYLGFQTLKAILECKKNVVDISFSPENLSQLSDVAIENNVTAIYDAGVAPGLPNYLVGYYNNKINIKRFTYYVGGLPLNPEPPFNYKAPFSPIDVIEEYTRPARMMVNKKVMVKPAMSDLEIIEFEKVGKLEAFNTDGLRSLIETMKHIPNMKEKTLRYPGHTALIQEYINKGMFSKDNIERTSKELFKAWKLSDDEKEFTLLKVIIESDTDIIKYSLYNEYDAINKNSSMAKTTGFTATASINLILNKLFTKKGIFPPEVVGAHKNCLDFIISYLKERSVLLRKI